MTATLYNLKNRRQFLAVQKGKKQVRRGLIVQALKTGSDKIGFGLTTTKKIGNAVVRNRARRRLRDVARAVLPHHGRAGFEYVFVARITSATYSWDALQKEARDCLRALHK